jgi:hypothetical protein
MQYSLPGENKDGGIYIRASTWRDRDRQKCNILYLERTKMVVFTRESTWRERDLETKLQYSLPGEDKDGGIYTRASTWRDRDRQKCNILYLETTKMEVFTLENLPKETEIETKMHYSLPGENKDGGIYTRESTWRDRDRDNIAIISSGRGQR